MKNLNDNAMMQEMNSQEMQEVNGGGEWKWSEAAIAFALLGLVGVGFYTVGTMQD